MMFNDARCILCRVDVRLEHFRFSSKCQPVWICWLETLETEVIARDVAFR